VRNVNLSNGVDGNVHVHTVSYRDIPFRTVVRQQYDFSCGSAALATLLTYHFDRPTSEREVFKAMYEMGDQAKIQREGFSLFEMKQYLESLGYSADGFRVPLDKVARVGVPVIVLIEWQNYKHFVVIKGIRDGKVLIGDPARGLKVMPVDEFTSYWKDGIIFAIHSANAVGKQHFNDENEWKGRPKSPTSAAFANDSLRVYNLAIPGGGSVGVF
jgi:predicted double-glycine peptidase